MTKQQLTDLVARTPNAEVATGIKVVKVGRTMVHYINLYRTDRGVRKLPFADFAEACNL